MSQYPLFAILEAGESDLHIPNFVAKSVQTVHLLLESLWLDSPVIGHMLKEVHETGSSRGLGFVLSLLSNSLQGFLKEDFRWRLTRRAYSAFN
jgi:hypothetical protein